MISIELNDETKAKATRILDKAMKKCGKTFGMDENHKYIWTFIEEEFPQLFHSDSSSHPHMFMIYLLLASNFKYYVSWEQVYNEFNVEDGDRFEVQEEGFKTTCICGQNTLKESFVIQSKITGIELELGSSCILKHYIKKLGKEEEEKQHDILKKQMKKASNVKYDRKKPGVREAHELKMKAKKEAARKKREAKEAAAQRKKQKIEDMKKEYIRQQEENRKMCEYEKGELERKRAEREERDQRDRAAEQHQYKHLEYKRPPIAPPITLPPRPPPAPKTTFSTIVHYKVDHDELIKNLDKQKREKERKEKEEWSKTNGIRKFFN